MGISAGTYTLRVDLDSVVVEDVAVALAADGALVEGHDVLQRRENGIKLHPRKKAEVFYMLGERQAKDRG